MAIESAKDFIALVDSGKYLNAVNAKRGAGRTGLSAAEKEKVFAYIDSHFPADGETAAAKPAKVSKRMAKVAKKKVGRKPRTAAPVEDAAEEAEASEDLGIEEVVETAPKAPKKKVASKKSPVGTLPISPNEVKTVADVLQLVDSTVQSSVSVINALRAAHEISKTGDINRGIETIKQTLEGAANMLHHYVVAPLSNTHGQPDPTVAARLEQVVAASANGLASNPPADPSVTPGVYYPTSASS